MRERRWRTFSASCSMQSYSRGTERTSDCENKHFDRRTYLRYNPATSPDYSRVRDETAETLRETSAWSREGERHTCTVC
jgi:hypothetical protein